MNNLLKSTLVKYGFGEMSAKKTQHRTFYIGDDCSIVRAYTPYLEKKAGKIAVSGIVGVIDFSYSNDFSDRPAGINIFGRHMLSLTSEWNLPWFVDFDIEELEKRVCLIKSFLDRLPMDRMQLCKSFRSGELEEKRLILDLLAAREYVKKVCVQ